MTLSNRVDLLVQLGEYMLSDEPDWQSAKLKAHHENSWFIPEFIELATRHIAEAYLQKGALASWINDNNVSENMHNSKNIGIVMAGNIPLVGFHDFLCAFVSGHRQTIKTSSKDNVLIGHLVQKMQAWNKAVEREVFFEELLKGCDAYIATGSNNSARYFEYYFGKYPHIIRHNRTSVGIIGGDESRLDLELLSDDVYQYFGLGCRNVTKLYMPENYDFFPLLEAFKKYNHLIDHHKYKNNYDYRLAVLLINRIIT
jgi:hypothetical protein